MADTKAQLALCRRLVIAARADLARAAAALGIVLTVVGCNETHGYSGPLCASVDRMQWNHEAAACYTIYCPLGVERAEQTAVGAFIECRCHAADGGKL